MAYRICINIIKNYDGDIDDWFENIISIVNQHLKSMKYERYETEMKQFFEMLKSDSPKQVEIVEGVISALWE